MGKSLEEINSTVSFDAEANAFRKFLMYLGPGLLVAVGYMDRVTGLRQCLVGLSTVIYYYL